jgi:NADPH:quinone reductase-like Zn-dependent oxidoreductase
MKAAIVRAAGQAPVYADFDDPAVLEGTELIAVSASALSPFSKSRSMGSHYSSEGIFPSVAGAEGTGRTGDGRRVYFVLPDPPYGALAQLSRVRAEFCIAIPDGLDDVTAAAIGNPGMSAWVALVERARLQRGETVLVNGATGTAGRLAVQLAKYLGAGKVIATGRNERELEEVQSLGADVAIPLQQMEQPLIAEFSRGIDVAIDYLWGESARTIIVAIARAVQDAHPVRFIQVGAASREEEVKIPSAALRSSAIQLMGSGVKSIPFPKLLDGIRYAFEAFLPAKLQIATKSVPLSAIEEAWGAPGRPRIVVTVP